MKILILQDRLRSGGTERQAILLAHFFAGAGQEVTLLTFRPGGELMSTAADIPHRSLQPFDLGLDWFAPGLVRAVRKAAPDVVLCMGRMANCRAGSLQKKFPRITVIATMRTGKKLPWLFRRSLHVARHIVANSHDAAATLAQAYNVPAEKITVIHNSLVFPPAEECVRNEALRVQFDAKPATVVLLDVAMFRPEKNQRELIELVSRLPLGLSWQLWLAGTGPERAACEYLVAEKNLGTRVKFLGFQTDPTPLYSAADLAVHASLNESLPNFLIEAHAHGLASLAYDVGGVRETGAITVPPGNQTAFLARLQTLLTDSMLRTREAATAQAYAREQFAPETQAQAYLDLFISLRQF